MHDLDLFFMKEALKEAELAYKENEVPIGAVLVDNLTHKIISKGHNKKEATYDVTNHAEIICIREAEKNYQNWRLDNCTLYVTVEPCTMCASAIIQSRISRIVFGISEYETGGFGGKLDLTKSFPNPLVVEHSILEKEIKELLQKFFKIQRKK